LNLKTYVKHQITWHKANPGFLSGYQNGQNVIATPEEGSEVNTEAKIEAGFEDVLCGLQGELRNQGLFQFWILFLIFLNL
jgi:hypothetical protein